MVAFKMMFFISFLAFVAFFFAIGAGVFFRLLPENQNNCPEIPEMFTGISKFLRKVYISHDELELRICTITAAVLLTIYFSWQNFKVVFRDYYLGLQKPSKDLYNNVGFCCISQSILIPCLLFIIFINFLPEDEIQIQIMIGLFRAIMGYYYIPFQFFQTLILWTFSHIALSWKAKSTAQKRYIITEIKLSFTALFLLTFVFICVYLFDPFFK